MSEEKTQLESKEKTTWQLILEFNLVAILTPLIILGGIYLYTYLTGTSLTKSQWKQLVFIVWAGVILIFFIEMFKTFLRSRK